MSFDVCISYSSRDRERVVRLADELRAQGITVWIDQGGIEGATLWGEEIVRSIEACRVLVLALSRSSAESYNVVREVSLAVDRKKPILPILLEAVDIPPSLRYPLAGVQNIELAGADGSTNMAAIIRALARLGISQRVGGAAEAAAPRAERVLNAKLIAVLPFLNLSPDAESDYFSDGLTEELISKLSKLREISVVSRMNTRQYKGIKTNTETIGRDLGSRYIVEGTVRRFKDDVRITADLTDIESASLVWSETYKGKIEDIFDIQERVSLEIAEALRLKLTKAEEAGLAYRSTTSTEAYDLFLRAKDLTSRGAETYILEGIQQFEQAIRLDPRFARAYAGLGEAHARLYEHITRQSSNLDQAMSACLRAVMYDASLPEAYSALATAYRAKGDVDAAAEAARKAIELNPHDSRGYYVMGSICTTGARHREAIDWLLKAEELDRDSYSTRNQLDDTYRILGDTAASEAVIDRQLAMFPLYLSKRPDDLQAQMCYATYLARRGRGDEAIEQAESGMRLRPSDSWFAYYAAIVYSHLGNAAKGAELMVRSVELGFSNLDWIRHDPDLRPLHAESAFRKLVGWE